MTLKDRALKDPFYCATWHTYQSEEILLASGFFDDKTTQKEKLFTPNFLSTPVIKLKTTSEKIPKVLLTTGSFAPIHQGHISMMQTAKNYLEQQGEHIIGGYISPSHDSYVLTKPGVTLKANERIYLIERALQQSDWLMCDSWEALGAKTALNFTDIIQRLEEYLRHHIDPRIEIIFVFGGDNAGFARAFLTKGQAICVGRLQHQTSMENILEDILIKEAGRTHFIKTHKYADLSSTSIRAKRQTESFPGRPLNTTYAVRNEGLQFSNFPHLAEAYDDFSQQVFQELSDAVGPIEVKSLDAQQIDMPLFSKTLSLDLYVSGTQRLDVSRLFAVSDAQFSSKTLINRPGSLPLDEQIKRLKPGAYTLIDDDSASGFTFNTIKNLLPPKVYIKNQYALSESFHHPLWDIVDLRDFCVGADNAGLVVLLPDNSIARAPYMYPYVSLATRAKIHPTNIGKFSRNLWRINQRFHEKSQLKIKECAPYFRTLAYYTGFSPDLFVADFCAWHIENHNEI